MHRYKILLLGSTGFVGRNLVKVLSDSFDVYTSVRQEELAGSKALFFDFCKSESWENILSLGPDIIVNAAGYGVVKYQTDLETMRRVNYYLPYLFKEYLDKKLPNLFWFQIGSAFEYDLSSGELTEDTPSMPLTEYGLTKVMFSDFLKLSSAKNYCILRPFAMFGPYEDETKIVPSLILAQKNKRGIALSNGLQRRDYFYVRDLGSFLENLIIGGLDRISGQTINVGSNRAFSLRDLAAQISVHLSDFNEDYWKWGKIEQRSNENVFFCNASAKCRSLGFVQTGMSEAFIETIDYYYQSLV